MRCCRTCKHSMFTSVPDTSACIAECKKHYTVDPISGFKLYTECKDLNSDGTCSDYEVSVFRKFLSKFLHIL